MAFVNPQILQQIFGQQGAINSASPDQRQQMISMLAGAGAGMTQAAGQPGAGFAQALGGGAAGMMQGQQQAQQMQMNQLQMQRQQREMERQERIGKIMGDILGGTGGRSPDWASRVDAVLPKTPQFSQMGQPGPAQTTPLQAPAGILSRRFEVGDGGVGTVSSGRGDPGGRSYGTHQLSSAAGTMQKFLQSPEGQPFATQFGGLEPGSPQFNQIYQEIAQGAGPQFEQAQKQYLERTHVQPVMEMAQKAGLPVDNPAVQEALYSQAIQHGGEGNLEIINRAMASLGPDAGPEQVIDALYDAREPYAVQALRRTGASEDVIEGVRNRYQQERQQAKQMAGQQAPPVAQRQPAPQQGPQNSYQRAVQTGGGSLGLPPETRQLLAIMDPEQAVKALWDLQTQGPEKMPADVRSALFMAGGDEELARQIMLKGTEEDDMTVATRSLMQRAELFGRADPSLSESDRLNLALKRNVVRHNPVDGRVEIVDTHTGEVLRGTNASVLEAQGESVTQDDSDVDVSLAFGAPSVLANLSNTLFDVFGADLPRPDVERAIARVTSLGIQGDVLLSEQFTGRVSNQLLNMIGQLKATPNSFFQGPSRGRERMQEMDRIISRDLERQRRIANDPNQGPAAQRSARAAVEALGDYQSELKSVLEHWGGVGAAGDDDDIDAIMRLYQE